MRIHLGCSLVLTALAACPSDDDGADTGTTAAESAETTVATDGPGATSTSGASVDAGSTMSGSGSSGDTGLLTNGCGTFDPNTPGDSVMPQDPDDPEIIAACTALCEVLVGVPDCTTDTASCIDTCKMRSCSVCPGTIAPLVECEAEMFTPDGCTCDATGAVCPTPDGCADLAGKTGACGG